MYLYNFMILPLYFLSIIFSLSSTSWMMIWTGMEMNLLSFIFIILSKINMTNTESSMKYFLIQSIGSIMFLLSMNMTMIFYNEKSFTFALVPPLALMLKSGMVPLHFWTPPVVSKFNVMSLFMFLTFQKLVPFFILFSSWFWMMTLISFMNIIVGSIGGIIQSSIIKMIIFSSINNIGWMIMSMMESMFLFIIFFVNYTILTMLLIKFIKIMQIKWMLQIKSNKQSFKWMYFSIMMSMSGFPPFLGFTPKWLVIKKMVFFMPLLILTSILLSIFTLFFYIKSSLNLISNSSAMKKWIMKKNIKINLIFFINMMGPILFYLLN